MTELHRDLTVRYIAYNEIDLALTLIDQFDRARVPWPEPEQQRQIFSTLESVGGGIVGAFTEGLLLGTCTINICANLSWSGRPYAIIENVIVSKEARNREIGKAVLAFAVEQAKAQGCYKVMLMTGSNKPATLAFYRSAGFDASKTGFQIRFDA